VGNVGKIILELSVLVRLRVAGDSLASLSSSGAFAGGKFDNFAYSVIRP
jgi:hypothetical protein